MIIGIVESERIEKLWFNTICGGHFLDHNVWNSSSEKCFFFFQDFVTDLFMENVQG